jgi:hypothetical protein
MAVISAPRTLWRQATCRAPRPRATLCASRPSGGRSRGRVSASLHFIIWGALAFGALAGSALGTFLSVRWAIGIGAAGVLVSAVWIALSVIGGVVDQGAAATLRAD